jgi:hypothetical protein
MKCFFRMFGGASEASDDQRPVIKRGMIVPGLRCKLCGFGAVEWLSGGSWVLTGEGIPQPHYLCYNCQGVFHLAPKRMRIMKNPEPWRCSRLP